MKALVCEMCNSNDLVKQDGLFVCQNCGTKYSVEEARKMMMDDVVDIQGTVMIDNSNFVEKYLANARRAKEKEDWEETEKYYNMVEQNDPDNIEAIFYSAYGKAKQTLLDKDIYKRQDAFNVLKNCISVVDDHYKTDRREENKKAINSMATDLGKMICSSFVYTEWKNGYGLVTGTDKPETYRLFGTLLDAFKETVDNIEKIDDQPYLHEASIALYTVASKMETNNWSTLMRKWINEEKEELNNLQKSIISNYWKEHSEEKAKLDSQKSSLEGQISDINAQIEHLPETIAVNDIHNQIDSKRKEQDNLSMFKMKEKKVLQEQLEELWNRLHDAERAKDKASASLNESLSRLREELNAVNTELTKVRE